MSHSGPTSLADHTPPAPSLAETHAQFTRDLYLWCTNAKLLAYVNVFVNDFLGLAQGHGTAAATSAAHSSTC